MKNQTIINEYFQHCKANDLTKPTIKTYESFITNFSKTTDKGFKDITKKDIQDYIENNINAKSSKEAFKKFIKSFFKWFYERDLEKEIIKIKDQMKKEGRLKAEIDKKEWELKNFRPKYPMVVDWIKTKTVPTSKSEKDVLEPNEIMKLINACDHPQYKAMISLMWDCAMRKGQLCDIKIGDLIIYDGKIDIDVEMDDESVRTIPTTDSTQAIFDWLNQHPFKDDKTQYLFISLANNSYGKKYSDMGVNSILNKIAIRAGFRKHINPHMLRHSRTTFWKRNNVDSTTIKHIGLWKMNSTVPDTVYNHAVADDYRNNLISSITGIIPEVFKSEVNPIKTNICPRCGEPNASSNDYCKKCREPISEVAKIEQEEIINQRVLQQVEGKMKDLEKRILSEMMDYINKPGTVKMSYKEIQKK